MPAAPPMDPPSKPEDEALAARLAAGDRGALEDLAGRFQDRLYRVALLHCGRADDAVDLVQEILLAVWGSIGGYRPGTRFDAWLMRLAANRAVSWRRKLRVRRHAPMESLPDPAASTPMAGDEALAGERRDLVRRALAGLPERERLLLVLRTVEGWTPEEIGKAVGMQSASVSVALSRARSRLRGQCEALGLSAEDLG